MLFSLITHYTVGLAILFSIPTPPVLLPFYLIHFERVGIRLMTSEKHLKSLHNLSHQKDRLNCCNTDSLSRAQLTLNTNLQLEHNFSIIGAYKEFTRAERINGVPYLTERCQKIILINSLCGYQNNSIMITEWIYKGYTHTHTRIWATMRWPASLHTYTVY